MGEPNDSAITEPISTSNSNQIMSSKSQAKVRKGPLKKKTVIGASSQNKLQSKLKPQDDRRGSDTEESSSDEKFLEEFESDCSEFISSSDSEDLSQEFSDEDRLMEYYEKKLREHAIVGNFGACSDSSEDSEPSQELKKLVEDAFKPKLSDNRNRAENTSAVLAKKAGKLSARESVKLRKPIGKLRVPKTTQKYASQIKAHAKFENASATKSVLKSTVETKPLVTLEQVELAASREIHKTIAREPTRNNICSPSTLTQPGSNRSKPTPKYGMQPDVPLAVREDHGSYQKVADYLARIKQVQNSIIEINHNIDKDGNTDILKSARDAILKRRSRNKKSTAIGQERHDVDKSKTESESPLDEKHRDEVVDQILNAALGVS